MKPLQNILNKCILIVLAIQLLNMSVNNLNHAACDRPSGAYAYNNNEIDCAFEYVTEHLLGWDNYLPESGHHKTHAANHLHKTGVVYCCTANVSGGYIKPVYPSTQHYPLTLALLIPGHEGDINPPPPKI